MLENISNIISGLLLTITALIFGSLISNNKISKQKLLKTLIIVIAYSVLYGLIYKNINTSVRSIINFIINTLVFKLVFNFKLTKSTFIAFLHNILLLLSEIILFAILLYIFKLDTNYIYDHLAGSLIVNIEICTIFSLSTILLRKPLKKLMTFKVTNNKVIISYVILTVICIDVLFFIFFSNLGATKYLYIGLFSILVFIVIMFSLIYQKIKNENLVKEHDNLIEFVKKYENIIEKQRIERHENKNTLINIKSKLIDSNESADIIKYIDTILKEKTTFSKEKYAKLGYLPANGLKGLFYYKINYAESIGIKISISIPKDVSKSLLYGCSINNYKDLCKILGVYLDNAIEASAVSDKKTIGIEIYDRKNYILVVISNSYKGIIDKAKILKGGYSTKGTGRGYGLSLVKYIIKKSKIFESDTVVTENLYIQKLKIKKTIIE